MGGMKPGRQRRRLAEVAAKTDAVHPGKLLRQPGDDLPRTVRAAVVDVQSLQLQGGFARNPSNFLVQQRQAFLFVKDRDDDGDHGVSLTGGRGKSNRLANSGFHMGRYFRSAARVFSKSGGKGASAEMVSRSRGW